MKTNAPFTRTDLAENLDKHLIGNRMLFGGNLLRQPAFTNLVSDDPGAIRAPIPLTGSDQIMKDTLFLGTYPGLDNIMIDSEIRTIAAFISGRLSQA